MQSTHLFEERYALLNPEQRRAVDTIEGPVLVVAGPGSGKTELLGMRVANILQKTDAAPQSILCLTFTEAAALNMRERLVGLIGHKAAHEIAVHTFHSFGSRIIEEHAELFFGGAKFQPADELTRITFLEEILKNEPHSNQLRSFHPEKGFVYLWNIVERIGDLKRAGMDPQEFREVIEENKQFLKTAAPIVEQFYAEHRINSKAKIHLVERLLNELRAIQVSEPAGRHYPALHTVIIDDLAHALIEAQNQESTKPLTEWKNAYTTKKSEKIILKEQSRLRRHLGLADVYEKYQTMLYERGRFDFDDMLMQLTVMCERNADFAAELRERFQYVLVDEFQDTSGLQMKILDALLDDEIHNGRPNVLAVGDDDQSIFRFQGAQIANILNFAQRYRDPDIIVLTKNYRSTQQILDIARHIIQQGEDRLETRMPDLIKKELRAEKKHAHPGSISHRIFASPLDELAWCARDIQQHIAAGAAPHEIAVLAPKHAMLEEAARIFNFFEIPVVYERQTDILKDPQILQILTIFEYATTLMDHDRQIADAYMPEILSYPFWGISRITMWNISLAADIRKNKPWISVMLDHEDKKVHDIAVFLINLAAEAKSKSAAELFAYITGTRAIDGVSFISPFKSYYLEKDREVSDALHGLLHEIERRNSGGEITAKELLAFIKLHRSHNIPINITQIVNTSRGTHEREGGIQLMTVFKAKGLEFDHVYAIGCTKRNWISARNGQLLPLPRNLFFSAEADTVDDKLRTLFVALTRARLHLTISSSSHNKNGREEERLHFLQAFEPEHLDELAGSTNNSLRTALQQELFIPKKVSADEQIILQQRAREYRLSASALTTFLDIEDAGPQIFMEKHLLRFPFLDSPEAAYGTAMHAVMEEAIKICNTAGTPPPLELLLQRFTEVIGTARMNRNDMRIFRERGEKSLPLYYSARVQDFRPGDYAELNLSNQNIEIEGIPLTGKIDKVRIDGEEATIYDFKTGKPIDDWKCKKAWRYQRQLTLYKLMLEAAPDFRGIHVSKAVLEFLEPDEDEIRSLDLRISAEDIEHMRRLVKAVGSLIRNLEFPDVSRYPKTLLGIRKFEEDIMSTYS
ncbi:hypothetical protein COV82_03005 [Candidatus Peregrinibacteria bacterium CG11_big_fil_rev_8_21_14_0_20_46_8]|nr:MAG: hypothetical protein COV82_03005 [Candidatus Peregrinibacteria bacterium CG11_big_fil_rev_8_21_14_0_20_46_8]